MNDNTETNDSNQYATSLTVGELLKHARETLGISTEEIAKTLNLRVTLVNEIENNEFGNIAAPTYVRGYLVNYANQVEVDVSHLNSLLDQQVTLPDLKLQSFSRKITKQARDSRGWFFTYAIGFTLVGMLVYWWTSNKPGAIAPNLSQRTLEELVVDGDQVIKRPNLISTRAEKPAPLPQKHLHVQAQSGAWIEVQDATGNYLLEGAQDGNHQYDLVGAAPFSIVIDKPHLVTILYEGRPVDLSFFKRDKVARFQWPKKN